MFLLSFTVWITYDCMSNWYKVVETRTWSPKGHFDIRDVIFNVAFYRHGSVFNFLCFLCPWNRIPFFLELEPKVFCYTFLLTVKRNCKYRLFAIKGMICLDFTGSWQKKTHRSQVERSDRQFQHPNAVTDVLLQQEAQRATYRAPEYNVPPLWEIGQDGHFCILIGPKNTNFVEDIEILLPVKFRWIPFSGFRGEVENVSANQRPGRPSCFSDRPEKHKLGRGRCDLAFCQVSLNSVQRFQRRSRKYEKLTTDDGQRVITIVHLSLH